MSKRKLLLADDSLTIQKVVNLTFADEGIDVEIAKDGSEAIDRINAGLPDIILADIHMPGTDGYRLCEMIRGNDQTKDIPVVLLVGSFEPFDANEAARVGASSVLTKPFSSIRALVDKVNELLDAAASTDDSIHATYAQAPETPREEAAAEISEAAIAEPVVDAVTEPLPEIGTDGNSDEPDDIDFLYQQSLSSGEPDEPETIEYIDAGMDDEMVEAEHFGGYQDTEPEAEAADETATEEPRDEPAYQESTGFEVVSQEISAPQETPSEQEDPSFEETSSYEGSAEIPATGYETTQLSPPEASPHEHVTQEFETFDEFKEDSGRIHDSEAADIAEFESSMSDYRERNREAWENSREEESATESESAYQEQPTTESEDAYREQPTTEGFYKQGPEQYAEGPNEPEQSYAEEPPSEESAAAEDPFEFEEVQLLELPNSGSVNLVTSSESIAQDSLQRAVSLSPELIDMIVERVVERLRREG